MADDVFFDGQRDNEDVIRLWRRHPWTAAKPALLVLFLTLVVVASLRTFGASLTTSFFVGIWLITVPIIVGYTWFLWWNDLYILTNLRLVDINQQRVFHRTVAELPVDMIQDVTFEVRGPLAMVLNYGNVIVQTTGGGTVIELDGVTDPQAVQQAILRTAGKSRQGPGERPLAETKEGGASEVQTTTFLVTDVVGSTALWDRYPKAMPTVIEAHDEKLAAIVDAHRGEVFKSVGDGVYAVFPAASDALAAAVAMQRLAQSAKWRALAPEPVPPLKLRIGVHSGEAKRERNDYVGPTVNRVSRITALGDAGTILVSRAVKALTEDTLPAKTRFFDRGQQKLKGLRRAEHLYQLAIDDLTDLSSRR